MARHREEEQEFGSESFLDVVANVVGILIILVMIVGMRIQRSMVETIETANTVPDILAPLSELRSMEGDLRTLTDQALAMIGSMMEREAEQQHLATAAAEAKRELEQRRRALSEQSQQQFDARRQLAEAQSLANQLQRDLESASQAKRSVTVQSYPTPLARMVDGKEAHFQLKSGRIAYIPLQELLARLKSDGSAQLWKLKDLPEATATVGPVGGFRLRYTLQRVDVPMDDQMAGRRTVGSFAQLSQYTLIPSDNMVGETLEDALGPQSELRTALTKHSARDTTVTLWTYPDSFNEFRQLKKELYQLGYAIAGRPLPPDTPIGGSPRGSKSAAQ